jgi:cytochrome c biogenesis protein CcdA/thiol-disulfide isomerase/thioredoxin
MVLLLTLSYIGGALTILAPCILPIVPFVFAKVDQPFVKSGLPLLAGMALTFAAVGSLGAVAGDWAIAANEFGRTAAIFMLAVMGVALITPRLAERLTRPLVALGSRLSNAATTRTQQEKSPAVPSFLLGIATGLLWAPCAGPILGLILTGAALQGPSVNTSLLLLAYGAGAVSSLALALLAGNRVFAALKRSLGIGEWFRKGLGVTVLAGVAVIALGWDTGLLSQSSETGIALEKRIFERLSPSLMEQTPVSTIKHKPTNSPFMQVVARTTPALVLPVEGQIPSINGAVEWLNSPPLTNEQLHGKVVLINFWTFGCINCRNALPHVREWYSKYKDQGLIVIGVHAPEFAFEKNIKNVKRAIGELNIEFPVAIDNNFTIWRAFKNNYWPANYFIDAQGRVRFHHFGEGEYEKSEQVIQQLLEEAKKSSSPL